MTQNQRTPNDAQLRLLLPSDWIEELDTLAQAKFKTRLALIRQYLREKIDQDLTQLSETIARRERVKRAKTTADRWLVERERREDDDQW